MLRLCAAVRRLMIGMRIGRVRIAIRVVMPMVRTSLGRIPMVSERHTLRRTYGGHSLDGNRQCEQAEHDDAEDDATHPWDCTYVSATRRHGLEIEPMAVMRESGAWYAKIQGRHAEPSYHGNVKP